MNNPKHVLIIGLTERMGGVETFIYNTTRFSDPNKIQYDYLIHGADHCVFEEEITRFYGDHSHFFFVEKYKRNPFRCLKDLFAFYRKNGKKYDWIHLQTGAASEILYVFPFCLFLRARVLVHSHNGNGYSPRVNRMFRPVVNLVSSQRLACSELAAKWLFGDHLYKKSRMIHNGIDVERFTFSEERRSAIRKEYGIEDCFVMGHVGRFSEQKNHTYLLDIFAHVRKNRTDAKLLLLGGGEKEAEIRAYSQKLGLEQDIIYAGIRDNTEDFYSAFDVFVMPSLYEGLPIVGIEAQSEGLPCFFSANIDRQIDMSDQTQILSLEDGAEVWSQAILHSKPAEKRETYSQVVRNAGFGIQDTVKELEKIYFCNSNV